MTLWMLGLAMLGAVAVAPLPAYRITVKADKHTDFSALRTYAWSQGWGTFDPVLDAHIVAAIDRELGALGLVKQPGRAVDTHVVYGAIRRTDVDLDSHPSSDGIYPEHAVATLVIVMLEPASRRELFRARVVVPVQASLTDVDEQIDRIIAKVFARYPTRHSGEP